VNFKTLSARKTDTHPLGARVTAKPATETASERRALLSVVVRGMTSRWLSAESIYPVAGRPDFYNQGRTPWYFGLATVKAAERPENKYRVEMETDYKASITSVGQPPTVSRDLSLV